MAAASSFDHTFVPPRTRSASGHRAVLQETDPGQPPHHGPQVAFEERPAGQQAGQADIGLRQLAAGQLPADVPQDIAALRPASRPNVAPDISPVPLA